MSAFIAMVTLWVDYHISRLFFYTVLVTLVSIGAQWLVGGPIAWMAGSLQFMTLVLYVFMVEIHLMFSPKVASEGWAIALLPFPIRLAMLIISAIVSSYALVNTAISIMYKLASI